MVYIMDIPIYRDKVVAKGHQAIKAIHPTTFELTKDKHLTEKGDCIIGIGLDKGVAELDPDLRAALKKNTSIIVMILSARNITDMVLAQGDNKLILSDNKKIIVRKSSYIDSATLAINSNKSARNIRRDLIEKLKNEETDLYVDIYVIDLDSMISYII